MTALDSEQLREAQHAIEHPEAELEPRYQWVIDLMACAAIVLILVFVCYQIADRWVS